jgi:hypothetical protein
MSGKRLVQKFGRAETSAQCEVGRRKMASTMSKTGRPLSTLLRRRDGANDNNSLYRS